MTKNASLNTFIHGQGLKVKLVMQEGQNLFSQIAMMMNNTMHWLNLWPAVAPEEVIL